MATVLGDLTRKFTDRSVPQGTDLISVIAQLQFVSDTINTALSLPLVTVLGDISRKVRDYTQLTAGDYLSIIAEMQNSTNKIAVIKNLPNTIVLGLLVRNCQNNIKPSPTDFLSIVNAVQVLIDAAANIINPNFIMQAGVGTFAINGKDTGLITSKRLSVPTGTFILGRNDAALIYGTPLQQSDYITIPDAPTFPNPTTRIQSTLLVSGELFYQDFGAANGTTGGDILIGNITNGLEFNGLNGDKTHRWRVKNLNQSTVITGGSTNDVHRQVNNCNFIEVSGAIGNAIPSNFSPYKVTGGQSGFNFANATATGTTIKYHNVRMYNHVYAGMLSNLGGGSNTDGHGWNGLYYNKVLRRFCGVGGLVTEGEGFYNGHTSTPYAVIQESISIHNAVLNKGREGEQDEHCTKVLWYNLTFRNVGQVVGQAGQTNLSQHHDNGFGIIENCIFDGAPDLFNLFLNSNYTFRNCYFRWTNGLAGFVGNTNTSYFAGSPRCSGTGTITFTNCTFFAENGGASVVSAVQIAEKTANFTFTNCKFSNNITNIIQDISGGHTGVFTGNIGNNGNTSVAYATMVAQKPTYLSDDILSPDFCKVTSTAFIAAGQGALTFVSGDMDLVEADEIPNLAVGLNTAFGANGIGVGLPQTSNFLGQDGVYRSVGITWSIGGYTQGTPGVYSVSGTPNIVTGIRNANTLTISTNVTVNASGTNILTANTGVFVIAGKPVNLTYSGGGAATKHIVVNLGGTAMTYVTGVNYNHIAQNFGSGAQTITGENSGDILSGLRKTDGVLTTYGITINSGFAGETLGKNLAGIFPAAFNISEWTNPSAGSRSFKITGLDNAKTYTLKIMCSVDGSQGAATVDVSISGASGGGTFTNFNQSDNVNNIIGGSTGVTCVPTGGAITITVTKNTGRACISGFDLAADGI